MTQTARHGSTMQQIQQRGEAPAYMQSNNNSA
jgi:hypothetical protein